MKAFYIEFKWALIYSAALLLWMMLEKFAGWHDVLIEKQPLYTNLFAIVAIVIYVLFMKDKRQNFFRGNMNWAQGFLSGTILTVAIALLSPIVQIITYHYITPDYFHNAINFRVSHNYMTQEQAESYFNLKSYMIQSGLGGLPLGVITAALVALLMKTKSNTSANAI
ncbi:MAG: DUF4199 domain-containing protein [Flavobacterium sp.]|nr:MAG: DUF4199 domain-containing protein [Flavobacterium sp.]